MPAVYTDSPERPVDLVERFAPGDLVMVTTSYSNRRYHLYSIKEGLSPRPHGYGQYIWVYTIAEDSDYTPSDSTLSLVEKIEWAPNNEMPRVTLLGGETWWVENADQVPHLLPKRVEPLHHRARVTFATHSRIYLVPDRDCDFLEPDARHESTTSGGYMNLNNWRDPECRLRVDYEFGEFGDYRHFYSNNRNNRYKLSRIGHALAPFMKKPVDQRDETAIVTALVDVLAALNDEALTCMFYSLLARVAPGAHRLHQMFKRTWKHPVWENETWWVMSPMSVLHQLHASENTPGSVAYADTIAKGMQERFVSTKAGRYLTRYFSNVLSEKDIKHWADKQVASTKPIEVRFAKDLHSKIRAIAHGPSESCMSNAFHDHDDEWFKGHIHPAAIYNTPDIEVAYCEDPLTNKIIARCVCNATNKSAARIYGDFRLMKPALEKLGYEQRNRALLGCRISKIANENGRGYIMAYVDAGVGPGGGALHFQEYDNQHWLLTEHGYDTYGGYDGNGVIRDLCCDEDDENDEDMYECNSCGEMVHEDSIFGVYEGETYVCQYCFRDHYREVIGRGADVVVVLKDDSVFCESNHCYYWERFAGDHGLARCVYSEKWYFDDDLVEVRNGMAHPSHTLKLDIPHDAIEYGLIGDVFTTKTGKRVDGSFMVYDGISNQRLFKSDAWQVRQSNHTYWIDPGSLLKREQFKYYHISPADEGWRFELHGEGASPSTHVSRIQRRFFANLPEQFTNVFPGVDAGEQAPLILELASQLQQFNKEAA